MNLFRRFKIEKATVTPIASSSITISMLANLALVHGLDQGRFNACEAWYDWDEDLIRVSLTDRTLPRRWPRGRHEWCSAWDREASADGTLQEACFAPVILEMSVDDIRAHLYRIFPLELVS